MVPRKILVPRLPNLARLWFHADTGGIRQNLFEIYYFEKLHAPRARGARARARAAREGRRDESTVNNSGAKLKFYEIHPVGNLLLFP